MNPARAYQPSVPHTASSAGLYKWRQPTVQRSEAPSCDRRVVLPKSKPLAHGSPPRLPLFKCFLFMWTAAVIISAWLFLYRSQAGPAGGAVMHPIEQHSLRTVSSYTQASSEPGVAASSSSVPRILEASPDVSQAQKPMAVLEFPSQPAAFEPVQADTWSNPRVDAAIQRDDPIERDDAERHAALSTFRPGVPGPPFPMLPTGMPDRLGGVFRRDDADTPFALNRLPGVFPRDIDRMVDHTRIAGAFPRADMEEQAAADATAQWFRQLHEEFEQAANAKLQNEGLPPGQGIPQQDMPALDAVIASSSAELTPTPEALHLPGLDWAPITLPSLVPPIGQVEMEEPPQVAYDTSKGGRQRVQLQLGSWKMKFPRFIRLSHVLWWQQYDFNRMRRNSKCVTILHPELFHPVIQISRLNSIPGDITLAKDLVLSALGNDPIPLHDGWYSFCEESDTTGEVITLRDVVVSHPSYADHPCSQADNVDTLLHDASKKKDMGEVPTQVGPLFWAYVTAAPFFQHWTQNVLPKIAMATLVDDSLYNSTDGTIWTATQELLPARFPIVNKMYEHMGWAETIDLGGTPLATPKLSYACNSPPLHPLLWQLGQQRLFHVKHVPVTQRKKIVYCGRRGNIENVGRKVLNEREMFSLLAEWGRSSDFEIVEFNHTQYSTVAQLVEFWSDARALIGPHGGCMTNVVFMPANALVVEAFPLFRGVNRATRGIGHMMYVQSMFLEHEYWMLPSYAHVANGNFKLELQELCEILVTSLGPPSGNAAICSNPLVYNPDFVNYVSDSIRSINWG